MPKPLKMDNNRYNILCEFLETYKNNPQLWNIHLDDYTNKKSRECGYLNMLSVYKKIKPSATTDDVKRKIVMLRQKHKMLLKKMQLSEQNAREKNDIYMPTVRWFSAMSFLQEFDKPKENPFVTSTTPVKRNHLDYDSEEHTEDEQSDYKNNAKMVKKTCMLDYHKQMWLKWGDKFDNMSMKQKVLVETTINQAFVAAEQGALGGTSLKSGDKPVVKIESKSDNNSDDASQNMSDMEGTEYMFVGFAKIIKSFSARRQAATKLNIATIVMEQELEQLEENEINE